MRFSHVYVITMRTISSSLSSARIHRIHRIERRFAGQTPFVRSTVTLNRESALLKCKGISVVFVLLRQHCSLPSRLHPTPPKLPDQPNRIESPNDSVWFGSIPRRKKMIRFDGIRFGWSRFGLGAIRWQHCISYPLALGGGH